MFLNFIDFENKLIKFRFRYSPRLRPINVLHRVLHRALLYKALHHQKYFDPWQILTDELYI